MGTAGFRPPQGGTGTCFRNAGCLVPGPLDALVPSERERVVWDDDIKGFGVRVHPTGRKVYIVKYRHEGRAVKATIGPHGPITRPRGRVPRRSLPSPGPGATSKAKCPARPPAPPWPTSPAASWTSTLPVI